MKQSSLIIEWESSGLKITGSSMYSTLSVQAEGQKSCSSFYACRKNTKTLSDLEHRITVSEDWMLTEI